MATQITLNLRDIITTVNIPGWILAFLRGLLVKTGYDEYVKGLSAAEVAVKGWTLIFYNMTEAEARAEFDSISDAQGCFLTIMGWNEWQDEHDLFKINHEVSPDCITSILNKFD